MSEEIDLTNPEHVAELLRSALPGFADQTPKIVAAHIDALRKSDHQVFGHIGRGEQVDSHAPVSSRTPPSRRMPDSAEAAEPQEFALDLGGQGRALEQAQGTAEFAGPPVYAVRGWSEIDRQQSKGRHEIYELRAKHWRSEPITAEFTGECQAVRVTLPQAKPPADGFVGTWIGTVEVKDHLAFSIDEVQAMYARAFGSNRPLARVDLITGARFRGRRFSPVSIYLGYYDRLGEPAFYLLEGGSAAGDPEAMYYARDLESTIHAQADFRFTPFACETNWYEGGLEMSVDKTEPACVYLSIAQAETGDHQYLRLRVTYERDRRLRRVIHPFEVQIEAALRVLALADQTGCDLRRGQGGALEHILGPLVSALLPWDERPSGITTIAERARFCGCPK